MKISGETSHWKCWLYTGYKARLKTPIWNMEGLVRRGVHLRMEKSLFLWTFQDGIVGPVTSPPDDLISWYGQFRVIEEGCFSSSEDTQFRRWTYHDWLKKLHGNKWRRRPTESADCTLVIKCAWKHPIWDMEGLVRRSVHPIWSKWPNQARCIRAPPVLTERSSDASTIHRTLFSHHHYALQPPFVNT
jgi:hypothetical protein